MGIRDRDVMAINRLESEKRNIHSWGMYPVTTGVPSSLGLLCYCDSSAVSFLPFLPSRLLFVPTS